MIIRDPTPRDETSWKRLWSDYNAFYETCLPDTITNQTWRRILDPASTIFARLVEDNGGLIGFSTSVLHEGTWTIEPICYLEDMFVDPNRRGQGVGRLLIRDLIELARAQHWSRLYWHTRANNPARRLYDQFAKADDFVRYRLLLN